jgi:DNA replication protein DnaC
MVATSLILSRVSQEAQSSKEIVEEKSSISQSKCEDCGTDKTRVESNFHGKNDVWYRPNCDCEYKKQSEKDMERERVGKENTRLRKRKQQLTQIPKRFSSVSIDNFIPKTDKQKKAIALLRQNVKGSFLISGDYGQGKTHLLWAQYCEVADGNNIVYPSSMHELLEIFKRSATEDGFEKPTEFLAIDDGIEGTHVFIDDVDKFKLTDFKLESLFDFIDTIYRQNIGLTMTSNSTLMELQEKLSPAIVRRIDDICTKIEL